MVKRILFFGSLLAALLSANISLAKTPVIIILPGGGPKAIYQYVVAYGSEGSLEFVFRLTDVVNIEVADANGNVAYQTSMSVSSGNTWSIPVDDWDLGLYSLTVTTGSGKVYAWDFDLVE